MCLFSIAGFPQSIFVGQVYSSTNRPDIKNKIEDKLLTHIALMVNIESTKAQLLTWTLTFFHIKGSIRILKGEVMDATADRKKDTKIASVVSIDEYRENIRRLMLDEVRKIVDEEMQKASQELLEEQRKAIRYILDEHKAAIRQVVEEEKKSIWEKAEMLRQSILKMGL
jgi:hypothetical protein